ncbi:hypothetical protein H0H92_008751 [Tricholoma furcatifolium]|nr:hypothetical protein H0H92_008751 [Tricholoma furcatifolium]
MEELPYQRAHYLRGIRMSLVVKQQALFTPTIERLLRAGSLQANTQTLPFLQSPLPLTPSHYYALHRPCSRPPFMRGILDIRHAIGSAKDEKCQKEMARKSSQDILHRRTLTSLDKKYWEAVGALGAACHKLNIRYFFLGGTAVTALGAGRTTRDIDVVIDDMDQHAANLVTELNGRLKGTTDSYGCVEYTMDGISADLFDLPSWPQHEDWKNIINAPYPIQLPQTGETVNIPHPRQLLSDKQRAAAERVNNKKGPQDATDVVFLQQYVQQHHPA